MEEKMDTFRTIEDAEKALMKAGLKEVDGVWVHKGEYRLRHGEYSSPDYVIRKVPGGYGIFRRNYFYKGTLKAPKNGRIGLSDLTYW
jgi:hypothetical protein